MAHEIALVRQVWRIRNAHRQEVARTELNTRGRVGAIRRATVILKIRLTLERVPKKSVLAATRPTPTHLPPLDRHQKYPAKAPMSPKVVAKKTEPRNDSALARLSIRSLCGCADLAEG